MRNRWNRLALALAAPILLTVSAGCATLDTTAVEQARLVVQNAQRDRNIDKDRSIHMQDALGKLQLAEEALEANRFQEEVDHLAYLAETHAEIAQVQGEARRDQRTASQYVEQAGRDTRGTRRVLEAALTRAEALEAKRTERGLVLTLGGVLFAFDSAELKPEAQVSVARVAGFLIGLENRNVLIEGHTDNVGTDRYNTALSKRRAESVRAMLIENRVGEERVLADGLGSAFPVASNDDEAGRDQNRRVEVIILDPGTSISEARRM